MAAHKVILLDLERQRSQLEKNVADLRKSLKHWQTWEAEYEGLKEEIEGLGVKPKSKALVQNTTNAKNVQLLTTTAKSV